MPKYSRFIPSSVKKAIYPQLSALGGLTHCAYSSEVYGFLRVSPYIGLIVSKGWNVSSGGL